MLQEFKDFINRGSVVELAVGLVMGAAFGAVINSFVENIVMPIVGFIMGGSDFSNKFITLKGDGDYATLDAAKEAGAITLNWGLFINVCITFLLTAFAIFMIVKLYNRMQATEEEAEDAAPSKEETLLEEIRDLLAKQ